MGSPLVKSTLLPLATDKHKAYFWQLYRTSMHSHIKHIWGWDEQWQKSDFETRWANCDNKLINYKQQNIGYIQTKELTDELYIMMLIIEPEYRSKGIGERLIERIRQTNRLKPIGLRVFKSNARALHFYQRQGFVVIAEEDNFYYLQQKGNAFYNEI